MQAVRLVKSDAELAVMQEACAIAEAVTESAIALWQPGVREHDVVAEAMRTLYRLGGEMAHLATPFVASGEHMSPPNRFASDKLIREGDLVFIDIGAMWCGYYADMGRTVVCGEPSARQREIFTAVRHALAAATEAMRPGNTNDDVAAAVARGGRSPRPRASPSCRCSSATGSGWAPTSPRTSARRCQAPRRWSSRPG